MSPIQLFMFLMIWAYAAYAQYLPMQSQQFHNLQQQVNSLQEELDDMKQQLIENM